MSTLRRKIVTAGVAALFLAGLCGVAVAAQGHSSHASKKQQPAAPQPPPPPAPLTLEQMPAVPPQVTYQNGELTIIAPNSTLGDILRAVRSQTGAEVDVPGNATERVVSQIGPGSARDVLAILLDGSHFNYVLLGSADDPYSLRRVMLTPKTGGGPENAGMIADNGNGGQVVQPPPPPSPQVQTEDDTPEDASEDMGDDLPEAQSPAPGQPGGPPPGFVLGGANGDQQQQPNIKTPEQLLQELQQRNQQLQQQQQQPPQPQAPPPNPPTPQ
jgi:hypothetical protein